MIIEIKQMLKDARWFWILVAITMGTGGGLRMFLTSGGKGQVIARVDGQVITQSQFSSEIKREHNYRQRLAHFGIKMGEVNPERVFNTCLKNALLHSMASQFQVLVDDYSVIESVKKIMPKNVFNSDGSLVVEEYKGIILHSGEEDVASFEENKREELLRSMITDILKESYNLTEKNNSEEVKLKRSFGYIFLNEKDFKKELSSNGVKPSDSDLMSLYEKEKANYKDLGFAKIKSICVDKELIKNRTSVDEKEVSSYYNRYKSSKYTKLPNYTVDFWFFSDDSKAEDLSVKIDKLIIKCKDLAEDFTKCEKLAKDDGLSLKIVRNHQIVLGEGKFSAELEKMIVGLKKEGSFSSQLKQDSQVHVARLVKREGSLVSSLEDVSNEIIEIIKSKKTDYEVGRISATIAKALKEIKATELVKMTESKLFENEVLEKLKKENGKSIYFREFSIDGKKEETEKFPGIDLLEVGKIAKVSDEKKEMIYFASLVEKSKPKAFGEVKEEVKRLWFDQKIMHQIKEAASLIKSSLINDKVLPKGYEEDEIIKEDVSFDDMKKEKNISEQALKILFKNMNSIGQVLINFEKDGALIAWLKKDVSKEFPSKFDSDELGYAYTENILEEKLKSATIEEYLSGELGRHKHGRN